MTVLRIPVKVKLLQEEENKVDGAIVLRLNDDHFDGFIEYHNVEVSIGPVNFSLKPDDFRNYTSKFMSSQLEAEAKVKRSFPPESCHAGVKITDEYIWALIYLSGYRKTTREATLAVIAT